MPEYRRKKQYSGIKKPRNKLFRGIGWGIGIRTPTNRVRVCRATVTQFRKIVTNNIIPHFFKKSRKNFTFLNFFAYLGFVPLLLGSNCFIKGVKTGRRRLFAKNTLQTGAKNVIITLQFVLRYFNVR